MRVDTLEISRTSTAVRRHDALLRYTRYLLIANIAVFLWIAIPELAKVTSLQGLWATTLAWFWGVMVLGSLVVTYFFLAHRWRLAFAAIFLAQVLYFILISPPNKQLFVFPALAAYAVIFMPPLRPLAPVAVELIAMLLAFSYMMLVCCIYAAAWTVKGGGVPRDAYGRRLSLAEPFRPTFLLDILLPGHRSQNVTLVEAALFTLSSVLFVAASTVPFFGFRRIQNTFFAIAPRFAACGQGGFETPAAQQATIDCWAALYPWTQAALDLGAPLLIAIVCLVLANRARYFGRQHFIRRVAELPPQPVGSTLFLRAFRDDQIGIRRTSRNFFSVLFDLGRVPTTLDELMLERLDGHGDLIAIGNPQDHSGAARRSPWGAQRLYVDDDHWQETVTRLAREADRIVLCVDASKGVRWEIAHVLQAGHADKTLFFLNPSIDLKTRTRLLTEDFGVSIADLASLDLERVLAVRLTSPDQPILLYCAKPERDAYLVAARLAFKIAVWEAKTEIAA